MVGGLVDGLRGEWKPASRKAKSRSLELAQLEERLLLSASPMSVPDQTEQMPAEADTPPSGDQAAQNAGSPQSQHAPNEEPPPTQEDIQQTIRQELVFIDASVEDYELLIADLLANQDASRELEFVLLDLERNGLEQITEELAKREDLDAVHIVSHGTEGEVKLGNTWLDVQTFEQHRALIESWSHALSEGADLLFYGCDLASNEAGQSLLHSLSEATGADIAASIDDTGHSALGGDWVLEFQVGLIQHHVAFSEELQGSWLHTLDITSNLLLHNTFDADTSDSSGNNYDGMERNGASIDTNAGTNQIGDGKLSLDGSDDFVELSAHVSDFKDVNEGTIAAWIYTDTLSGSGVIFEASDSGDENSRIALIRSGDDLAFYIQDGSTTRIDAITNGDSLQLNTWTHVAVTVNSSGNKIYINGVEQVINYIVGSSSTDHFFNDVSSLDFMAWGINKYDNDSPDFNEEFDGFIDDGRVYDRALSTSDISELYSLSGQSRVAFQEGVNSYTGTQDTYINEASKDNSFGNQSSVIVDLHFNDDVNDESQGLIRFDNIFGNGPGQIPVGATIISANLTVEVISTSNVAATIRFHQLLTNWSESSSWNSLLNGLNSGVDYVASADATVANPESLGTQVIMGLEEAVQAWSDGANNFGWAIISNHGDGWDFRSSEFSTASLRPQLQIEYETKTDPVITLGGGDVNYTENAPATIIDATATVTYADSGDFDTGTLTVDFSANGTPNDRLAIRNQGTGSGQIGVSGSNVTYEGTTIGTFTGGTDDSTPLVMTFNANGTPTAAQALLRNITYENVSENPDESARTVRFVLTDGDGGTSSAVSQTINVEAINDAPINSLPASVSSNEDTTLAFTGANQIQISDVDHDGGNLRVQLNVGAGGLLSLADTTGLSFSAGDGMDDANMVFTGSLAALNNALLTLTFEPTTNFSGMVNLSVTTNDLGNTGSDSGLTGNSASEEDTDILVITVNSSNDDPAITNLDGDILNYTEGAGAVVIDQSEDAVVGDADSANFDTGTLTVDFTANGTSNDRLSIRNQGTGNGQIGISGSNVTYEGTTIGTVSGGMDGSSPFVITLNSNATVAITQALVRNINYENVSDMPDPNSRTVRFVLTDGDGGTSNAVFQTINIIAENDAPEITTSSMFRAYTENAAPITIDPTLSVTDADHTQLVGAVVRITGNFMASEDVLTFTNQSGISGVYDSINGILTLTGTSSVANYQAALRSVTYHNTSEDPSILVRTFSFFADDGVDSSSAATRDLSVTSINDRPTTNAVAASGNEDAPVVGITISGSDVDGVVDRFQLTTLPTNGTLYLDAGLTMLAATGVDYAATGQALSLFFVPDPDWNGTTSFQYFATDDSGLADDTPATGMITINAVNDDPAITSNGGGATAMVSIAENVTAITTITSTDVDGGVPSYLITGGADQAAFSLDGSSGVLTFQSAPDFENPTDSSMNNTYVVQVTVNDQNGGSDVQTITVTITDQNDNAPVIPNGQSFSVNENAPNNTSLGTVNATDVDTVGSFQNWQITNGNTDNIFAINSATGEITVVDNTNLDFETTNAYTLTLTVSDGTNTSASETVLISILNLNEFGISGISDLDGALEAIQENQPANSLVGLRATATDADTSDTITYLLDDDAGGRFTIDGSSGVVRTTGSLDAETALSHSIIVRAMSSDGSSSTRSFVISVLDVDEFDTDAILDLDANPNQVVENSPINSVIGVTAFSSDRDATDTLTYTLDDDAGGRFAIDANSGILTVAGSLDFESNTSQTIIVRAASTDGSSQTRVFTIMVLDENDVPPVIAPGQNFLISENSPNGTLVGNVMASDVDTVGTLQNWTITSGNEQGVFAISPSTGEITIADQTQLDFEQTSNFVLTLAVEDGRNLSASQTITINLLNVNEAPSISGTSSPLLYLENSGPRNVDETLTIQDSDSATLTQAVVRITSNYQPGEDRLAFQDQVDIQGVFDVTTGTLTLLGTASVLDYQSALNRVSYENTSEDPNPLIREVTFTVSDGSLTSTPVIRRIEITAVNDAPTFLLPEAQMTNEGEPLGFSLANGNPILISDVDDRGEELELTLTTSQGTFTLSQTEGLTLLLGDGIRDSSLVLRGTLDQINRAFDGLLFTPNVNASGNASFSLLVEDAGNAGVGGKQLAMGSISISLIEVAGSPATANSTLSKTRNQNDRQEQDQIDQNNSQEELNVDLATVESLNSSKPTLQMASASLVDPLIPLLPEVVTPTAGDSEGFLQVSTKGTSGNQREVPASNDRVETERRDRKPRIPNPLPETQQTYRPIVLNSTKLFQEMDNLEDDLQQQEQSEAVIQTLIVGSTAVVAGSLTVGYMLWILRAGSLLATMLSYLPVWMLVDPLPILDTFNNLENEGEETNESLESLATTPHQPD